MALASRTLRVRTSTDACHSVQTAPHQFYASPSPPTKDPENCAMAPRRRQHDDSDEDNDPNEACGGEDAPGIGVQLGQHPPATFATCSNQFFSAKTLHNPQSLLQVSTSDAALQATAAATLSQ